MIPRAASRPIYKVKPEMMWKQDDQVAAARRLPGWPEFHRQCGKHDLFFDHIERDGKRGPYKATAFTLQRRRDHFITVHIADGVGKAPVEALVDAYRKAQRPVAEAELERLLGLVIDMEDILG